MSCHSLFWILQCLLITFRKKSRFLNSACKALYSLSSYSLSDLYVTTSSYTDEIPAIWNYMWFPILSCFITLPCFCAYCPFSIQCISLLSLVFLVKTCFSFRYTQLSLSPGLITNCFFWTPLASCIHSDGHFFHCIVVTCLCLSWPLDWELPESKKCLILFCILSA